MKKILFSLIIGSMLLLPAIAQSSATGRARTRTVNHRLVINTNLSTADIQVTAEAERQDALARSSSATGEQISARGNFNQQLAAGKYSITVSASGYYSETREIDLRSDQTLSINLRPMTAQVRINIPRQFYTRASDARRQVRVYANGELLSGGPSWELPAGRHTIRIESGGLQIEGTFTFQAGGNYTIEPSMSLGLR